MVVRALGADKSEILFSNMFRSDHCIFDKSSLLE